MVIGQKKTLNNISNVTERNKYDFISLVVGGTQFFMVGPEKGDSWV